MVTSYAARWEVTCLCSLPPRPDGPAAPEDHITRNSRPGFLRLNNPNTASRFSRACVRQARSLPYAGRLQPRWIQAKGAGTQQRVPATQRNVGRHHHPPVDSPRHLRSSHGPHRPDPRLHHPLEHQPQAIRLDGHRRQHPRQGPHRPNHQELVDNNTK